MIVLGTTTMDASKFRNKTKHLLIEREKRWQFISSLGGSVVISYLVQAGTSIYPQVHTVLDTGAVIIGSIQTKTIITVLVPNPARLISYGIYNKQILAAAKKYYDMYYNS